jgi:rRNA maturation endonuclease Nob1
MNKIRINLIKFCERCIIIFHELDFLFCPFCGKELKQRERKSLIDGIEEIK